jgi:hypothetical protein
LRLEAAVGELTHYDFQSNTVETDGFDGGDEDVIANLDSATIEIHGVANGWLVHIAADYDVDGDTDSFTQSYVAQSLEELMDIFYDVLWADAFYCEGDDA